MEVEEYSWAASSTDEYRYQGINGQEEDEEIFKGSYSAEYWNYDSRVGRRWNIDPRPITGISDYACFGNNPIVFTDVKGDSLNFSKALQGTDEFKTAMEQWEKYSGLILSIDENGDMTYEINKDAKGYSRRARRLIIKAIKKEDKVFFMKKEEAEAYLKKNFTNEELDKLTPHGLGEGSVYLNKKHFDKHIISVNWAGTTQLVAGMKNFKETEKETMGYGMTLLHETHHFWSGKRDPMGDPDLVKRINPKGLTPEERRLRANVVFTGKTVDYINKIRRDLNLPLRYSYGKSPEPGTTEGDRNTYIPFSKDAYKSLKKDNFMYDWEKGVVFER